MSLTRIVAACEWHREVNRSLVEAKGRCDLPPARRILGLSGRPDAGLVLHAGAASDRSADTATEYVTGTAEMRAAKRAVSPDRLPIQDQPDRRRAGRLNEIAHQKGLPIGRHHVLCAPCPGFYDIANMRREESDRAADDGRAVRSSAEWEPP